MLVLTPTWAKLFFYLFINLLLEDSIHPDEAYSLQDLFLKIPELETYIYFLSDLDSNYYQDKRFNRDKKMSDENSCWIDGSGLSSILKENNIEFTWGVLSAFKTNPHLSISYLPYAEGNPTFWIGSPTPQIKDAEFEIVIWDCASMLFIGMSEIIASKIKINFPMIKNLDEENRNRQHKPNRFKGN